MTTDLDKRPAILNAIRGIIINLQELEKALTKPSEAQQPAPAPVPAAPPPPLATVTPITPPAGAFPAEEIAGTAAPSVVTTPAEPVPQMTLEELKAQLQDIAAKLQPPETGFQQLSAMLQQFGVDRVSALKPEQYGEALVAATALLEKQVSS